MEGHFDNIFFCEVDIFTDSKNSEDCSLIQSGKNSENEMSAILVNISDHFY